MNTRSPRNDDDVLAAVRGSLTAVRDSLDGVHMDRPVETLVAQGRARRARRTLTIRAAVACGTAAATVAAVIAVTGVAGGKPAAVDGGDAAGAQAVAYVTRQVRHALARENGVFLGRTEGSTWGPTVTWSYGQRSRFVEYTGNACGHALPNGDCTHRGGSELFLADGTALVDGKLTGAYVTYFDRKYSLGGPPAAAPASACQPKVALEMGGPPAASVDWAAFISRTLDCGAASVTGHVKIHGVETMKITGKPVTLPLVAGEARAVHAKWARVRWILYVNSATYLPVRMFGSTHTFGGSAPSFTSSAVTDVTWLPPTPANIARALVVIPPGFHRVASAADQ
ncbi:MAG TPA: hypothetical protein VH480_00275 [Streptosporangiaceae bacterium]